MPLSGILTSLLRVQSPAIRSIKTNANASKESFRLQKQLEKVKDRFDDLGFISGLEMIYIYENNKIKIVFKYQNPFQEAMESIVYGIWDVLLYD